MSHGKLTRAKHQLKKTLTGHTYGVALIGGNMDVFCRSVHKSPSQRGHFLNA
jgi:hypothetical protein